MRLLPRHTVRGHLDLVDLDQSGPTIGIDAAEPLVMLAGPINQLLKTRSQVFNLPTLALSVSIRCIERRIWVEPRRCEGDTLNWDLAMLALPVSAGSHDLVTRRPEDQRVSTA